MLKPHAGVLSVLHRLLEGAIVAGTWALINEHLGNELGSAVVWAAIVAALIYLVVAEINQLYQSWRLSSLDQEFRKVFVAWGITFVVAVVIAFLLKVSATYSRVATVAWFLMTPALLLSVRLGVRVLLRTLRRHGANSRTLAIAGSGPLAEQVISEIQSSDTGIKVVGIFDDRSMHRTADGSAPVAGYCGGFDELIARAKRGELDYVAIALPMRSEQRIIQVVSALADTTASVYLIPDLFMFDLMRARWTQVGALPAVSVYESPFDGINGWLKRAEDIVLASLMLAFFALPMMLISIGVARSTGGSVFFRQKRYGLNGRIVEVLKFRTMTVSEDGNRVPQARKDDSRVTPFGRFLRSSSLDELPQLFNVLRGDMSLVGPRPHAVAHNEEYRRLIHGYMLRHKVKPGITGWAQINGWRGETDSLDKMKARIEHDLQYVQNWSLWLDLKILARTVVTVLSGRNAY